MCYNQFPNQAKIRQTQIIALAPTLSKVFEWCLLLDNRSSFSTSSLQFGFKQGLSTDHCTGLVKNVVARYTFNDSDVYGCFLDASKAFDRVMHNLFFEKLLKKNLSPVVVTTLLSWYSDQLTCFCSLHGTQLILRCSQ